MDPIADMFSQIKNAINASKKEAEISYAKTKLAILEILKSRGYIEKFEVIKNENQKYPRAIKVVLKYQAKGGAKKAVLSNIKRLSRPGRRMYVKAPELENLRRGRRDVLISTSSGIMSLTDARKKGLGGEAICEVK